MKKQHRAVKKRIVAPVVSTKTSSKGKSSVGSKSSDPSRGPRKAKHRSDYSVHSNETIQSTIKIPHAFMATMREMAVLASEIELRIKKAKILREEQMRFLARLEAEKAKTSRL